MDFDEFERRAYTTDTISAEVSGLDKLEYCVHGAVNQLGDIAGYVKKHK